LRRRESPLPFTPSKEDQSGHCGGTVGSFELSGQGSRSTDECFAGLLQSESNHVGMLPTKPAQLHTAAKLFHKLLGHVVREIGEEEKYGKWEKRNFHHIFLYIVTA